ncbi:MAG TPA: NAD-dependent epimerase/dehydratase family protein [Thermoflexales bacterium]|nr:NAD-dependent epimerase/dehydratase family protein [Thermoflexales bacterium]HQZ98670.1 NAD-dependent epimerase/dehydratase family protein [Thermoflexales bacterium]
MKFLVTGGAGFLGAALSNTLAKQGHTVRVLDDFSSGDPTRLDPSAHVTRGDVADTPKLWSLLQGVDAVYHLAARVSVPESVLYPGDYNTTNVGGTVALLQAMRDAGARRVIMASSGAVYGEQHEQPLRETHVPNPASPYAVSKISAEYYLHTIGALWGFETVSLRVFNAYGPGQHLRASHPPVVPAIIRQALGGGSIIVHGDGKQSRDFVYVDDVVSALVAAATAPSINRLTINVGSGVATSINEVVAAVGRVLGKELTPLRVTAESGGVSRMWADLSRARERLNYAPQVSLDEGLSRTIAAAKRV